MTKIVLELLLKDKKLIEEFINNNIEDVHVLSSRRFQGEPETIQLLINLSPIIIPALTSVIVTHIRAKKHISIKCEGLEIKGISESTVVKILNELNKNENKKLFGEKDDSR